MPRRAYAGAAPETTLASDITASSTTISGTDFTGYPSPTAGKLSGIVIDPGLANEEKIEYDTRSGNTLTGCLRGRDNTSASAHTAGAIIRHIFFADDAETANAHVFDTTRDDHTQYLNTTRHDVQARHGTASIGDGAITLAKLAADSVDATKIVDGSVGTAELVASIPRGEVAKAQRTSNQGTITTETDLTDLSVSWSADSTRIYKITVTVELFSSVANDTFSLKVTDGSNVQKKAFQSDFNQANIAYGHTLTYYETGVSGDVTRKVRLVRSAGTGNLTSQANAANPAQILVEDIGT